MSRACQKCVAYAPMGEDNKSLSRGGSPLCGSLAIRISFALAAAMRKHRGIKLALFLYDEKDGVSALVVRRRTRNCFELCEEKDFLTTM
jgi:hypothetical protein